MSEFNKAEKIISNILSNNPKIKILVKKFYQRINYIFYKKKYKYFVSTKIEPVDTSTCESFFGYYDKSPENNNGDKVIFYRTMHETTKLPSKDHPIEIVVKCLKSNSFSVIDKTYSYNWQQGAKMMWLNDNKFIYNIYSEKSRKYQSKIYNIKNKTFKILKNPIYDCYSDKFALSLNFSKLMALRPDYGYRNIKLKNYQKLNDHEGIFKISFKNDTSKQIINLNQLTKILPKNSMINANHKLNHIMISPHGDKFIFMHRWITKNGKRYDRLLLSNTCGDDIKIVSDYDMVSHCNWIDNNTIVAYMSYKEKVGFFKVNLNSMQTVLYSKNLEGFGDGHPSFNKNLMLFDSYPNKSRMKKLYIHDHKNHETQTIGEFFESLDFYGETRCDLHPRFNFKGNCIYLDSVHDGKRKLYKLNIND